MSSLDSADQVGEPAFASERLGVWLMGAYWLALLVVGMAGAALGGN